ncbi:MAG TPA: Uma2 family endonuclease [Vicinamibacterales bacterium]|nr:Uma2 family endonuclease [Vicinamibacterales bacterium]
MTTAEYLATPESLLPQELAFGVWRVAESPTPRHQEVVLHLLLALHEHLQTHRVGTVWLSPLDVILDDERALVVQPDLFVISNEREHILTDRVHGAPDLVVEVLSPQPRVGDINERIQWFAQYDVRECWLVHQIERWIDVLTFEDGRTAMRRRFTPNERIESGVLPAFDRSLREMLGYSMR